MTLSTRKTLNEQRGNRNAQRRQNRTEQKVSNGDNLASRIGHASIHHPTIGLAHPHPSVRWGINPSTCTCTSMDRAVRKVSLGVGAQHTACSADPSVVRYLCELPGSRGVCPAAVNKRAMSHAG